jgi:acyl-coenzyme A synthetase/AMP-(fatty) acid ligase
VERSRWLVLDLIDDSFKFPVFPWGPGPCFAAPPTASIVLTPRGTVSGPELAALAGALATSLPSAPAAVNLCEHRDNFLVAFLALLMRGQACLLPPSRASAVIDEVMSEQPGCYRVDDARVDHCRVAAATTRAEMRTIPPDRIVVVGYTSGSTGAPQPNPKSWQAFVAATGFNAVRIREAIPFEQSARTPWILATVPSQHMYGMETAVLLPILAGMGLHAAHPLFPADIAAALAELPEPRILVTTPVHLRALLESDIDLPPLAVVVSATAPLAPEMARRMEQRYGAALVEFFGSTETCVIASRRTAHEAAWRPYPGVSLRPTAAGTEVDAPWFAAPALLQDVLEIGADGTFVVRGRSADMVEVGGKRASLADLTRRLLAVPGVRDGIVFQPDRADGAAVQRLAALVVAEGVSEAEVIEQLAPGMDPVFLPRPLVFVSQLPRNDLGKLPRERLLAALRR